MSKKIGINFRVNIEHIEKLKKIAREKAYKEDVEVSYIDLIKKAYEDKYGLKVEKND